MAAESKSGRGFRMLLAVAVLVVLAGGLLVSRTPGGDGGGPPQPPASAARPYGAITPDAQAAVDPAAGAPAVLPPSAPVRVAIPKIGTNAPLVGLSLEASGELAVPDPDDRNVAGWYQDGVTPGSPGTAIVVAHVDTKTGPAAFFGLGELRPGDTADITRADGVVATFRIESVEVFEKKDFPSERVYADTEDAQLRLITCGGAYDRQAGGYQSNVVAFARLVGTRAGG
ncbi:class F sortase [Yinghuangia soli]|uniref:Class F sortase n=1 Tax=Yinghuangia soli TaxID=2908204 RepID=A0AA41U5E2_9ACTN|nr:class F sortase [Yinghuangia soli]MCF2531827.1 class F sortase [Yinghuangia soli]